MRSARCSEASVREAKKRRCPGLPWRTTGVEGRGGVRKAGCFAPHFIPPVLATLDLARSVATECVRPIHGRIRKVNVGVRMDTNNGLGHPQRCTGRWNGRQWSLGKSALIPGSRAIKGPLFQSQRKYASRGSITRGPCVKSPCKEDLSNQFLLNVHHSYLAPYLGVARVSSARRRSMASGCLSLFGKALINSPSATVFPSTLLNPGPEPHAREQRLHNVLSMREIREPSLFPRYVVLDPGLEAFSHMRLPCAFSITLRTSGFV